nr:Ankyrin repeat and KH domain-containing protein [Ipomoea batatas]
MPELLMRPFLAGATRHDQHAPVARLRIREITLCTMEFGMFDNSECSSGCESGWTVYLENSIMAPYSSYNNGNKFLRGKARNLKEKVSMLDDTASSPIFNCTNNNFTIKNQTSLESVVPDFSQGYSTTQFQENPLFSSANEFARRNRTRSNKLQCRQAIDMIQTPVTKMKLCVDKPQCLLVSRQDHIIKVPALSCSKL